MKPPPFEYYRAESAREALDALAAADEDAKVIAGGQSLIPLLNLRLARPSLLVDINRAGLAGIGLDGDRVRIGATVRQTTLEHDPTVAREAPLLRRAARLIGHPAVRSRGTIGGSLAHADPAAELCAAAVALDAEVEVGSARGPRALPAADLFTGPFTTALAPDELILSVDVPRHGRHDGYGCAYEEVAARAGDFAFVGVATLIHRDPGGRVDAARVVVSGAASAPVLVPAAEDLLGAAPSEDRIERVASAAAALADPADDVHAPADYRRSLAGVLTRRALIAALGWEHANNVYV